MSEYQAALVIGAIVTFIIAAKLPRAGLWIAAGALAFILPTAYARYGLYNPPAFTLTCDALVCLAIYFMAREEWEKIIYHITQLSVLISLLHMSNLIADHWLYIVSLELCNWAVLLTIGATATLDRIKARGYRRDNPWGPHLSRAHVSLRAPRSQEPFHKVRS